MRHTVAEWKSLAAPLSFTERQLNDWQAQIIVDAIHDIEELEQSSNAAKLLLALMKEMRGWIAWAWQYIELTHGPRWEEGRELKARAEAAEAEVEKDGA